MPGIRRLTENGRGVGVVYGRNEDEEIAFCQRCWEMANVRSKLGSRIYLPDEFGKTTIPPDADTWRQCHTCGSIYPTYQVKQEGKLSDFAEVSDNPFEFGRGVSIMSVGESRKYDKTGRRQHKRKLKKDRSDIKEEDVRREVAKGAKLISYHEENAS